jgi:hypothetical protein
MARTISSDMLTAIADRVLRVCLLAELQTTGATIYLSSLDRNISYSAQSWLGNSWLRPFSTISEASDLSANGCEIALGGLDATAISAILSTFNKSKLGTIHLGLLDSSYALIASPIVLFKGYFDSAQLTEDGDTATAVLSYESQLIRQKEANEFRYTDQSQQALFAGDLGFQYAAKSADWSGFWGRAARPQRIRKRKARR